MSTDQPTSRTPETTDELRGDIDSGRTGDKVAHSDPAAAPLGTDAEAGGQSPAKSEVRRDAPAAPRPAEPRRMDDRTARAALIVGWVAVLLVVLGVVYLGLSGSR